jgi:hypothetical protein
MISLWDVAPDDMKDNETGALDQDWQMKRVASAYGALFSGTGSKEDADIVLVDIAQFTRYYDRASDRASPRPPSSGTLTGTGSHGFVGQGARRFNAGGGQDPAS